MRPPSLARDRSYSASDLIRDHIAFAQTGGFGAGSRLGLPSHVSRKDRSVAPGRADKAADSTGPSGAFNSVVSAIGALQQSAERKAFKWMIARKLVR
jgi:hypothetical protein